MKTKPITARPHPYLPSTVLIVGEDSITGRPQQEHVICSLQHAQAFLVSSDEDSVQGCAYMMQDRYDESRRIREDRGKRWVK